MLVGVASSLTTANCKSGSMVTAAAADAGTVFGLQVRSAPREKDDVEHDSCSDWRSKAGKGLTVAGSERRIMSILNPAGACMSHGIGDSYAERVAVSSVKAAPIGQEHSRGNCGFIWSR